jgi:hypothetical protein
MTRSSTQDKAARITLPKLRKKQGVWVYRADEHLSDAVVRATSAKSAAGARAGENS